MRARRTADERRRSRSALQKRLAAIPGVTAVTAATPLPLDGQDCNVRWGPPDARDRSGAVPPSDRAHRSARLLRGDEDEADRRPRVHRGRQRYDVDVDHHRRDARGEGVPRSEPAVDHRQAAALSHHHARGADSIRSIGVVGHQRHLTLAEARPRRRSSSPMACFGFGAAGRWAVRTTGDPTRLIPASARRASRRSMPQVPLGEIKPMSDVRRLARWRRRGSRSC